MKTKLFDYVDRDNFVYQLSGLTKLVGFICMTFAVMFSYDIRFVLFVMLLSLLILKASEITYKQIKVMVLYVLVFLAFNFVMTFIFSPTYGVEIYGTEHILFKITTRYTLTQEQLLYQVTKVCKYASVVPLGILFILTTNPSEFGSSLNRIGISYKGTYAVALTLRYFPDMMRDYHDIALAQQSRGLDLSKKEKLGTRVKNVTSIFIPLLFSTLDRIELISNAMDLRGFGKHKKRTWYVARKLTNSDIVAICFSILVLLASLFLTFFVNHSRFWNPFM